MTWLQRSRKNEPPSSPPAMSGSVRRKQGQHGYSLVTQHQSLDDFASANGWALPEHLRFRDGEDADASGADWDLPGLTAMLDAARRGEFGVLVVPDLDRLARSLAKGLVVQEQLKKYGVRTVFLRVPTDDTPEGDLLKNQLLTFAQYERDKTRLRTMLNKQTKARLGEVVGAGPAPYGYRYTTKSLTNGKTRVVGLEPDPAEAAIVARIFSLLPHRSTVQIADLLNDEGIPAPRGARWLHGVIYNLATSTVYTGTWMYGKPRTRSSAERWHRRRGAADRRSGHVGCGARGAAAASLGATWSRSAGGRSLSLSRAARRAATAGRRCAPSTTMASATTTARGTARRSRTARQVGLRAPRQCTPSIWKPNCGAS